MRFYGRHFRRDERGQSLVEFALVLPMLLVVMLMITEFGRALFQYNVLAQATRAGARTAAVLGRAQAVAQAVQDAEEFIDESGIDNNNSSTVTAEILDNYNGSGRSVIRVHAEMPFNFVFSGPLPANADGSAQVTPTAFTLVAENTMHAEQFIGAP
jgi:Flp pilus assembly protein TadG